jgi:fibrillarin-like pre-rRNA processing protein
MVDEAKEILHHSIPNVYTFEKKLLTKNLTPGLKVYGEELIEHGGIEYRVWNPWRSKLAALILKGARTFPFGGSSNVLYLGAATGTTSSHISDIAFEGIVYCVEVSPKALRKLIDVCANRQNMVPILADAGKPEGYSGKIESTDIVYQDIAQKDQVKIFLKNLRFLKKGGIGYLMVKARSIDVSAEPKDIYKKAKKEVEARSLKVIELIELDPYEKDHAAIIVEK